ncbi:MAG TPA: hypothetical protein VND64_02985 [Pirellulales bacterium]|nr:hypothetical protein [Pirellulales bacterium]
MLSLYVRAIRVIRGFPELVGPVRIPSLIVLVFCAAFLPGPSAFAQRNPDIGYVFPPGGQAGTTVEVNLGGYDWTPDMEFFVLDRRAQLLADGPPGEILVPPPPYWFGSKGRLGAVPLPREVPARFVVAADCPPGPVYWQAANANGGTATGVFVVGTGPQVVEDECRKAPQALTSLPVTVSGRISKIEEVDRYRFVAPRAGPVTCDLVARRLGANWHGCLEVRDAATKLVADVVDAEGLDTALTFAAQTGAEYEVAVRDIDHAGDRSYVYQLTIAAAPRVVASLPAAGRRGETREVEFVGIGVATGALQLESVARPVTFPTDPSRSSLVYSLETPFGTALPFELLLSDLPELIEPAAPAAAPHELPAPAAVTGALDQPTSVDRYLLEVKQGERWTIALEARRFGSPLDVSLAVVGPDGKELANNDDLPGTTDAGLEFAAPADGGYQLVVSDMAARGGTRAAVYRLSVAKPQADFRLEVPQRVNVLLGGSAGVLVKATRLGGFAGPIKLTFAGLPAGVSAPAEMTIPADKSELAVALTAGAEATAAAALVKVTGEAKVGETTVTRQALAAAAGNLAPRGLDGNLVSEILVASMMKPRVKGRPVDQDTGRKVHRGATFPADVIVERLEGYQGEIVLKMAARQSYQVQGITGDDIVVPPGVTNTIYPCHMPEWLETTRTSRMGMISVVQVPDPRGRVRHLVAEMTGFITMTLEGPLLKLAHVPLETPVVPGQTFDVRLKISRSAKLAEPVRLELRLPEDLTGLLSVVSMDAPLEVPLDREEAELRIATTADPRLAGVRRFTIRATGLQDGKWPAVSETTVEVDFSVKP